MKKLLLIFTSVLFVTTFIGCSSDDDSTGGSGSQLILKITAEDFVGTWKLTSDDACSAKSKVLFTSKKEVRFNTYSINSKGECTESIEGGRFSIKDGKLHLDMFVSKKDGKPFNKDKQIKPRRKLNLEHTIIGDQLSFTLDKQKMVFKKMTKQDFADEKAAEEVAAAAAAAVKAAAAAAALAEETKQLVGTWKLIDSRECNSKNTIFFNKEKGKIKFTNYGKYGGPVCVPGETETKYTVSGRDIILHYPGGWNGIRVVHEFNIKDGVLTMVHEDRDANSTTKKYTKVD